MHTYGINTRLLFPKGGSNLSCWRGPTLSLFNSSSFVPIISLILSGLEERLPRGQSGGGPPSYRFIFGIAKKSDFIECRTNVYGYYLPYISFPLLVLPSRCSFPSHAITTNIYVQDRESAVNCREWL